MKEAVKHASPQEEYFTSEGCFILELSNAPDDPGPANLTRVRRAFRSKFGA
jgi:hypothetical protein